MARGKGKINKCLIFKPKRGQAFFVSTNQQERKWVVCGCWGQGDGGAEFRGLAVRKWN